MWIRLKESNSILPSTANGPEMINGFCHSQTLFSQFHSVIFQKEEEKISKVFQELEILTLLKKTSSGASLLKTCDIQRHEGQKRNWKAIHIDGKVFVQGILGVKKKLLN